MTGTLIEFGVAKAAVSVTCGNLADEVAAIHDTGICVLEVHAGRHQEVVYFQRHITLGSRSEDWKQSLKK